MPARATGSGAWSLCGWKHSVRDAPSVSEPFPAFCGRAMLAPASFAAGRPRRHIHHARGCRVKLPALRWHDTVSERLRRWTRNPLGSARRGSNPLGVVLSHRHLSACAVQSTRPVENCYLGCAWRCLRGLMDKTPPSVVVHLCGFHLITCSGGNAGSIPAAGVIAKQCGRRGSNSRP